MLQNIWKISLYRHTFCFLLLSFFRKVVLATRVRGHIFVKSIWIIKHWALSTFVEASLDNSPPRKELTNILNSRETKERSTCVVRVCMYFLIVCLANGKNSTFRSFEYFFLCVFFVFSFFFFIAIVLSNEWNRNYFQSSGHKKYLHIPVVYTNETFSTQNFILVNSVQVESVR